MDALEAEGLRAFGPRAEAARIEGSKAFAKELMREAGIPTASWVEFTTYEEAEAQMDCASYPRGAEGGRAGAGKGVIIAALARGGARGAARRASWTGASARRRARAGRGAASRARRCALLALCDGERAVPMAPAQDFKRVGEGDTGPNTGGMGSYSPVPGVDADARGRDRAGACTSRWWIASARTGHPSTGVLYAG